MPKPVVSCTRGHRFPVNLDKNQARDHVFCPSCREKVVVRKKHIFSPNPKWSEEKDRRKEARLEYKESRKPKKEMPQIMMPSYSPEILKLAALASSKLLKKEKENEEN